MSGPWVIVRTVVRSEEQGPHFLSAVQEGDWTEDIAQAVVCASQTVAESVAREIVELGVHGVYAWSLDEARRNLPRWRQRELAADKLLEIGSDLRELLRWCRHCYTLDASGPRNEVAVLEEVAETISFLERVVRP